MNNVGRTVTGWLGVLLALAAGYLVVAGLAYPPALRPAEPVLCPSGQKIATNEAGDLRSARKAKEQPYAQFCHSRSALTDVTTRWTVTIAVLIVLAGLSFLLRAKVTPPRMRAPVLPVGH